MNSKIMKFYIYTSFVNINKINGFYLKFECKILKYILKNIEFVACVVFEPYSLFRRIMLRVLFFSVGQN